MGRVAARRRRLVIGSQAVVGALNHFPAGSYPGQWFELVTNATVVLAALAVWSYFYYRKAETKRLAEAPAA